MKYKGVDTFIYKIGGLLLQEQKGRRIELSHVLINMQHLCWIKFQVAFHTFHSLQHVKNIINVSFPSLGDRPRVLIGSIEA